MSKTVFFSWQADTPVKEGRNLVERALERAITRIGEDTEIEEAVRELEVDKDTKGVAGSPPIVETIFRKIDQAAAFVPDLTFVGKRLDGRPTPNPNVLVEYGWALKSLGHSRIVPIMNTAFGEPTVGAMPFDMAHLRHPIQYNCPIGADEALLKRQSDALAKTVEEAIRTVLGSDEFLAAQSKPGERPPFVPQRPEDGLGRFRSKNEPIGIAQVSALYGPPIDVRLTEGPAIWLRVMPVADVGHDFPIADLERIATSDGLIMPLYNGPGGYGHVRAHDGFGSYQTSHEGTTSDLVFLFKTGEIWAINSYLVSALSDSNSIPVIEKELSMALKSYGDRLLRLGIVSPLRWTAGMEGLRGRGIYMPRRDGYVPLSYGPSGRCMLDSVEVSGVYSPGESPGKALSPFFERLYEVCGTQRPAWLSEK